MQTPEDDHPIDRAFYEYVHVAARQKRYVKIHYFTELHELLKEMSVVTALTTRNGKAYLQLATGEEIRLDRIVRMDNMPAPGHDEDDFYSCDC